MLDLLSIMFNVIVPIFLVIGVAYGIGKRFNPDPRGLSVFLIYLFIPALVFRGTYQSQLSGGELGGIAIVVVGVALAMMALGLIVSRLLNYPARLESALVLSLILVNAANYGIPLNTFAFGETGGNIAIIYYVISAILGNILGVYFASRGSVSAREAIINVFKVPIGYAAVLGLIFNVADIQLPLVLERSVLDLAAEAAIPGMLALLGLQLSRVTFGTDAEGDTLNVQAVMVATGIRLVIGPVVAVALALMAGLTDVAYRVAIVESSMPTAVLASALATEFGGDAKFVSAVTLINTLASIITLTALLALLGGVAV
jgi:hypothetical protein